MSLRLQTESPADQDMFRGGSHEKVAEQMAHVIRQPNINIVGLEGELGSGKSTILQFLQKKLGNEFTFINFDAERFHHGSTKKALIDVIHKGIVKKCSSSKEQLDKYKNQALGNIVEYDKKVSSRLSWWTVIFVLLSLLSVQMLRYILVDLNGHFATDKPINWSLFTAEIVAFLSPGLLVGTLAFLQNFKWFQIRGYSSVGDLFKRNSTDRIEETWLVNKEVGAIELSEALRGFTSEKIIPSGNRFILIIDNLDRVSADKVKELWSDMELIAGATHEHFRIVVPYSARQVAASLSVAGYSGREFIAKRIPVSFLVPPLITAGWQEALQKFWIETVHPTDKFSCQEATLLLERWKPSEYPRITPRLMKKFVNDIHILDLTVPAEEEYRHILIALYLLVVRYADRDIRLLLRDPLELQNQNNTNPVPDDFDEKLLANFRQLSRIFSNDTKRWSEFLMSIHYQADHSLARSELLDAPLVEAINSNNASQLEGLMTLWGFGQAWQRIASRIQIRDWIVTIVQLPESRLTSLENEIKTSIQILNANYAVNAREPFDEKLTSSLISMISLSKINIEPFIQRQLEFIVSDLNNCQETEILQDDLVIPLIQEANLYSSIKKESLFEDMKYFIDGSFYAKYLNGNEETYPHLKIEMISLRDNDKEKLLHYIAEQPDGDLFGPGVINNIKLSTRAVGNIVKESNTKLVNSSLQQLMNNETVQNLEHFRKIILSTEWHNTNLSSYYTAHTSAKSQYGVEYAAQAVAHMVMIGNFTGIDDYESYIENEKFSHLLTCYLRYAQSFHSVISRLKTSSHPYLTQSIKDIINNYYIDVMPTIGFVSEQYELVRDKVKDSNPMIIVQRREDNLIRALDENTLLNLEVGFLSDLFNMDTLQEVKNKLYDLCNEIFSSNNKITSAFFNLHENQKLILNKLKDNDRFIHMNANINVFADWFRDTEESKLIDAKNIEFMWSCIESSQRQEILDELHDVLLERHTRLDNRICIIHHFRTELMFKEPETGVDRRGIAALFNASLEDEVLMKWLDQQPFSFSKWLSDDLRTVTGCILEHQEYFPTICESSQYIKNRIDNFNIEKVSETE